MNKMFKKHNIHELKLGVLSIKEFSVYSCNNDQLNKYKMLLNHHFIIEPDSKYSIFSKDFVLIDNLPWHIKEIANDKPVRKCHQNNNIDIVNYVIDTGIDVKNNEFNGRAEIGKDFSGEDNNIDGIGHGTFVASLILGKTFSLCKDANRIISVKVLGSDGSGSMTSVLGGIEWVLSHHNANSKSSKKQVKSIINMSLGGQKSIIMDGVIKHVLMNKNIYIVVAAGNESQDIKKVSPASCNGVFAIMASTRNNDMAFFSNYGSKYFSPGYEINGSIPNNKTKTMSGTSFSSPIFASVLNHYIDIQPELSREQLDKLLQKKFKKSHINNAKDVPNYFPVLPTES
jgi:subtilisin family serine protease